MPFQAGFAQFWPVRYDVARNVDQLHALLSGVHADLLVLPELANSGYMYETPESLAPYAEPGDGSGPFLSALRDMAAGIDGVIVAGFAELAAEGGRRGIYNSAAAVSAEGVLQVYRKTHLFADEKDPFLPGDRGFRVFKFRGVPIGMMVCFDWHFPESARTLALRGAQIIAHPSNLVLPFCQTAMVTRSLENRVFSITANRYGTETLHGNQLTFTGASQVLNTRGERLLQAPVSGDQVALVEIDPALAENKSVGARNDVFGDRRTSLYA